MEKVKSFELGVLIKTSHPSAKEFLNKLVIVEELYSNTDSSETVVRFADLERGKAWTTSKVEDLVRQTNGNYRVYTQNSRYEWRRAEAVDLPSYF